MNNYCLKLIGVLFMLLAVVVPSKADESTDTIAALYFQYQKASNKEKIDFANQIFEATRELYDTAYHCSSKTNIPFLDAMMQDVMANYYNDIGNYEEALPFVTQCLAFDHLRDSVYLYEDIVSLAAVVYLRLGDFVNSIKYAEISLQQSRESNFAPNISTSLNNIAGMCLIAGQPEAAAKYIVEAIEVERSLDNPRALSIRYGIASEVFLKLNKLEEALNYGQEALRVEPVPEKIGVRKSQIAAVLMEMKREDEAYTLLIEAKESLEATTNKNSLSIVLGQLARIATRRGALNDAVNYLEQSMEICKQSGNKMLESKNCYLLFQDLRATRPMEAMNYLERYASLNDEMYNEKLAEQLQSFNVKYQKAETQHQLEIQQEQLSRHRLWNAIGIGVLIVLAIVAILLIRLLREQRRNNKFLREASIAKDELLRIANEEKLQAESARQQILEVADHISALGEKPDIELTKREIQIIQLFSRGLMSKEIADQLDISVRTVETHKAHIYRKLGISTSVELLRFAESKGLIVHKS